MLSELVGVAGFEPAASSSRSQRAMRAARAAARLAWEATSADVHWRPLLSVVIVTQLVTHPPEHSDGGYGPNTTATDLAW